MSTSTLSVTRTGAFSRRFIPPSTIQKQYKVKARRHGRVYAAYQEQLELNQKLMTAINQTIGWVESTGGCEESIRMLRKALSEVQS